MERRTRLIGLVLAAAAFVIPSSAQAQVWTEIGDAGGAASVAQSITMAGFTRIVGSFSGANDMDVYRFAISSPATFSASTLGFATPSGTDTMLFLFKSDGTGIAMNDDQVNKANVNKVPESLLPIGNPLYANLPAGQYLLGVAMYNNRPTSSLGTIFTNDADGVFGPQNAGVFTNQTSGSSQTPVAYSVTLTGVAAVPEPGTLLLTGAAALGALAARRRRRTA